MNRDCLVLGGGIIGLSIARELARAGLNVSVLDRQLPGRAASWAASGILPPPNRRAIHDPLEPLRAISHDLYPNWVQRLEAESGISIELERCGGIYIARALGEIASLSAAVAEWQQDGIEVVPLTSDELRRQEPYVDDPTASTRLAFLLPDEMQVRPPRLLTALKGSLARLDVSVGNVAGRLELILKKGAVVALWDGVSLPASTIIVAAGAWSTELLQPLGINLGVEPCRGQMVMWNPGKRLIHHVINEGPRYLVSRVDGRLLAGSTVEDVGFDFTTTSEAIDGLIEFGRSIVPSLSDCSVEAVWSGLRPRSIDGFPVIGRVRSIDNLIVATGHFRSGIHLAPATAECVGQIVQQQQARIDLSPFAPR
jgi:glycine oxidase